MTGASGFIGSAVVRALLGAGRSVRALVEPGADLRALDRLSVDRVTVDVRDGKGLRHALSGCEVLYHLAAIYRTWLPDPTPLYRVNVEGTVTTLLAAQEAKIKRIVYTSSIAALGLVEGGLADETTAFNLFDIASDYILSKWLSERAALAFADAGLSLVVVNPAFPFGPWDLAPTPTGKILLTILRKEVPGVLPGGICTIDVDDCAIGHLLAEEKGRVGERYILGGENISIADLVKKAAAIAGVKVSLFPIPKSIARVMAKTYERGAGSEEPRITLKNAEYAMRKAFFSNEKAKRELGLPTRPLEESLRSAIDWFRENGVV